MPGPVDQDGHMMIKDNIHLLCTKIYTGARASGAFGQISQKVEINRRLVLGQVQIATGPTLPLSVKNPENYQRHRREALDRAKGMHWEHILPKACDQMEAWARE